MEDMILEPSISVGLLREIRDALDRGRDATALRLAGGQLTLDQIKAIVNGDETPTEVAKNFNENHDPKSGQFSSGGVSAEKYISMIDSEAYKRFSTEVNAGQTYMAAIYEHMGYHAKPKVLPTKEFDALDPDKYIITYRGYREDMSGNTLKDQFRYGDYHWAGEGRYGDGTYLAYPESKDRAAHFSNDDQLLRVAIPKTAKMITLEEADKGAEKLRKAILKPNEGIKRDTLAPKELKDWQHTNYIASTVTRTSWAAASGYDVVDMPDEKQYVLLNRGAVIVDEKDFYQKSIPKYGNEVGDKTINFNPNHDPKSGQFASKGGGSSSSTTGGVDESGMMKVRKSTTKDVSDGDSKVNGDIYEMRTGNKVVQMKINASEKRLLSEGGVKAHFVDPAIDKTMNKIYGDYNPVTKEIRLNSTYLDHMSSTFYHEMGHAQDHANEGVDRGMKTFPRHMFKTRSKKTPLGIEKAAIVHQRINEALQVNYGLSSKDISAIKPADREKLMKGQFIMAHKEDGGFETPMFIKRQLTYMQQPDEVFADAYSQYRTNPTGFKEYAPTTHNILEGLSQ